MSNQPEHVVVLGGGPGGLACAHKLVELGFSVTVIERKGHVGGLCVTTVRDGFRFDLGGHRWFTKNRDLNKWFLKLMEGRLVDVQRTSRILFNGKYFDYPISLKNVISTAGLWTCAMCFADYARNLVSNLLRPKPVRTMEDAFIGQFGRRLYEMFFRRYSEKVWGRPCSQLSADWVSQRSKGLSIWTTLTNALLKPKQKAQSLIETFVYPRYGYQEICKKMAEDVESSGNTVILNAMVKRVDVSNADRVVVTYEHDGQEKQITGSYCVSTVPLTSLISYGLHPTPPPDVVAAAQGLVFRCVICVDLMLDMEQVTTDTWLYCHDEGIGFARFHEPRNWSPAMAPEGKTSLSLELFCSYDDETWRTDDDELVNRAVEDLIGLGLVRRDQVIDGFCVRARDAYPVYSMDYLSRIKKMHAHIEALERLAIVGRGGTFRYNNADHSIEMGLLTAQVINREIEKGAVMNVNTSLQYCESNLAQQEVDRTKATES